MSNCRVVTFAIAIALSVLAPLSHAQRPSDSAAQVRIQSFSIIVRDYDEAKAWYTTKLGFAVVRDQAFGQGERFLQVAPPGQTDVAIVLQKATRAPNPAEPEMATDYSDRIGKQVNIVLHTNGVQAYADVLKSRGVSFTSPVREMAWGAQATFVDLYGNSFVIVGPLRAGTSP